MADEIQSELDGVDFGDQRLNRRSKELLATLFADPAASINAACHGWTETNAAYRFFDNDRVALKKILAPHQKATHNRMLRHPVVLFAQDTTELDFSDHPPQGAGPLNSLSQRGFLDHSHMAITPEGLSLGVVEVDFWARADEGFGTSKQRQYDPLETKEKFRWLEGYRIACEWQRRTPGTQIVSLSDREGDIFELFTEVARQGQGAAEFVIRSGKTRNLTELDPQAPPGVESHRKLHEAVAAAPIIAVRKLELSRTPKRTPRTATLEIRATRVELKAPYRKHDPQPDVWINVVLVREVDPPPEVEPVEWVLLTTLPIATTEDVLRVVDYYAARWPIEVHFRIFKSGCRVEDIQLETAPRLLRCLMLYKIVAWRIQYLTHLGRECPELPCETLFTADEWKSVWTITQKEPIPAKSPCLRDFLLLLGKLGGHNGRKKDGPPGPQAIWVGIRRMTDFALAWHAFGPERHAMAPKSGKTADTCV